MNRHDSSTVVEVPTQKTTTTSNKNDTSATVNLAASPPGPSAIHLGEGSLDSASELALMVGYKNSEELERRGAIEGILSGLQTSPLRGIADESLEARVRRWGTNELPQQELETFWDFVKESLDDRTMKILIGAAVVSLILGLTTPDPRTGKVDYAAGWMEGTAILASVVIVTLVAAINNLQKQQQFQNVSSQEQVEDVICIRDGNLQEIPYEDVVVGDIVSVHAGMSLPFDALLIEGTGYSANESSMTGEADDISKSVGVDPFLISGTHIVDGCDGLAVVVAVGEKSFSGSIEMSTRENKSGTPLQEHLEEMADIIGRFGLAAAVLTFAVLVAKEFLMSVFVHSERFYFTRVFENLTTAVAIVVVAVPEGLPLSVTLSLAYSMKRMLQDKNLVRHLAACETMGGATIICTDKTGTLTSNEMEISSVYALGNHYSATNTKTAGGWLLPEVRKMTLDNVDWRGNSPLNLVLRKVSDSIALNYSTISAKHNRTASALLDICDAVKGGTNYDAVTEAEKVDKSSIQRFAFSSVRKRGSVVVAHSHASSSQGSSASASSSSSSTQPELVSANQTQFLSSLPGPTIPGSSGVILTHYVAGAAEMILQKCTSYVTPEGRRTGLTGDAKAELESVIRSYSSRGWRTLVVGLSERRANWSEPPKIAPDDPLTFLAVVGIQEPLRKEVPSAMLSCRSAGVRTIMVTGDNILTATHIAKSCHILHSNTDGDVGMNATPTSTSPPGDNTNVNISNNNNNNMNNNNGSFTVSSTLPSHLENVVIEGSTFREKSDDELIAHVLPRIAVLARASPLDKKRLISLFKSSDPDAVIAVTGDGTNDAPALKAADVGFSMNSGSDIAKRSSDIVLLDDNFAGVVKAIVWGRNVRDNIKKFLQFQLTVNGVACLVAFLGALVNTQNLSPLKPVQLLWLNLIMDTFAALALATELPHDEHLLSRSPETRTASMISPAMRTNIVSQGLFQLFVQLALLVVGEHMFPGMKAFSDIHITIVFNVFVLMQVFNFFNARKLNHDELTTTTTATTTTNSTSTSALDNNNDTNNNNAQNENISSSQPTKPKQVIGVAQTQVPICTRCVEEIKSVFTRSIVMVYIIVAIFVIQVFIVQFGGKFMSTVPLDIKQWLICIAIASLSLPVGLWSRTSLSGNNKLSIWSTQCFMWMLNTLTRAENCVMRLFSPHRSTGGNVVASSDKMEELKTI